jgi:hypothetical protein
LPKKNTKNRRHQLFAMSKHTGARLVFRFPWNAWMPSKQITKEVHRLRMFSGKNIEISSDIMDISDIYISYIIYHIYNYIYTHIILLIYRYRYIWYRWKTMEIWWYSW